MAALFGKIFPSFLCRLNDLKRASLFCLFTREVRLQKGSDKQNLFPEGSFGMLVVAAVAALVLPLLSHELVELRLCALPGIFRDRGRGRRMGRRRLM